MRTRLEGQMQAPSPWGQEEVQERELIEVVEYKGSTWFALVVEDASGGHVSLNREDARFIPDGRKVLYKKTEYVFLARAPEGETWAIGPGQLKTGDRLYICPG